MRKNKLFQLVFLTVSCTLGTLVLIASLGLFSYTFRWDFYTHFTNISNYFCLFVLYKQLIHVLKEIKKGKTEGYINACPKLTFSGNVSIIVTFLVFLVMLAPKREAYLNFTINSILSHNVMPVLFVLGWFLFYERKQTKWNYPLYALILPFIYIVCVYLHAAILGFDSSIHYPGVTNPLIYPYFFLDIETLKIGGVLVWLLMFFVAFTSLGYILFALDKIKIKKVK